MTIPTTIKMILAFGVGLGAGILGSKKYFKKKYSDICDQQVEEMKEYYKKRSSYDTVSDEEPDEDDAQNEEPDRSKGPLTPEQRKEIKEKLIRNHRETTNYAAMYRKKEEPDEDDILDESEEDPTEEYTKEHEKNRDRKPRLISMEALGDLPEYFEECVLYLYAWDEVLVDENDEVIEDPERLLGDCLTKYDFIDNDETVIFVVNYELSTCYEVQKVEASYTELNSMDE